MLTSTRPGLAGRRVLVVEDESMVTMLLQDFLEDMGCEVAGVASRLKEALEKIDTLTFDVAILDMNLNGEQTLPVAQALLANGRAVVFATGYAATTVPPELRAVPILQKPFQQEDLERALQAALGSCAPALQVAANGVSSAGTAAPTADTAAARRSG